MKRIAIKKGPIGRESLKAGGPFPIDVSGGDSYGFMRLMERFDICELLKAYLFNWDIETNSRPR